MTLYSYHASLEQFNPRDLLQWAVQAEQAGFDSVFASDHLQPWSPTQGNAALSWSWMAAALQATRRLAFHTITVPGGWRYSPAVVAQAVGTLATMFPDRVPWIALGSGEALNEAAVGSPWPDKSERNLRLLNGARSVKALLKGRQVTTSGPPALHDARIWCRPDPVPLLLGAATTPKTARWLGAWAEGLLTVGSTVEGLRDNIEAFRQGGGKGKPVYIKLDLSWAPTDKEALVQAYANWRFNALKGSNANLQQPEQFDRCTRHFKPEDMRNHVFVSDDLNAHTQHIANCAALGVQGIDLHHVGADQAAFIQAFGEVVLPSLRSRVKGGVPGPEVTA